MLTVARSVAPPRIVGYDRQGTGSLEHISSAIIPIDRLIADRTSQRHVMDGSLPVCCAEMKKRNLVLPYAAPHHTAECTVNRVKHDRIGQLFHSNDQFCLVKDLVTSAAVNHNG